MSKDFQKVPPGAIFILLAAIIGSLLTQNPIKSTCALLLVPFLLKFSWRIGEPPFLFFGLLWQWISINLKVFYANALGLPFDSPDLHEFPANIEQAYWLSQIGLIVFTIGLHLLQRKTPLLRINNLIAELTSYSPIKIILLYVFISIFLLNYSQAFFRFPGFTQFLFQIANLKWGLFFLFFISSFIIDKSYRPVFFVIMFIEILLGFSGYFSAFKEFLIFFLIFYFGLTIKINYKQLTMVLPLVAFAIYLGLTWTAVKQDYRLFLDGGARNQNVIVSRSEALSKFFELYQEIETIDLNEALRPIIDRISYIDYFSACLDYVPSFLPYQGGKVSIQALTHIITPRLFFPQKRIVSDTEHLNQYTGLGINRQGGGSFSLGYTADGYIDFGPFLMFAPILGLGLFVGFMFHFVVKLSPNIVWAFVFAIPLYYYTNVYGKWTLKIIGQGVVYLIVAFIILKFIVPFLDRWLRK